MSIASGADRSIKWALLLSSRQTSLAVKRSPLLWKRRYLREFNLPPESMDHNCLLRTVQRGLRRPSISTFPCLAWGELLDMAHWESANHLVDAISFLLELLFGIPLSTTFIFRGLLLECWSMRGSCLSKRLNRIVTFFHQQTWSFLIASAGSKEYPVNIADSDPIIGGTQAFFLALTASVLNVLHMFNQPVSFFCEDLSHSWSDFSQRFLREKSTSQHSSQSSFPKSETLRAVGRGHTNKLHAREFPLPTLSQGWRKQGMNLPLV